MLQIIIIIAVLAADQLSKILLTPMIPLNESVTVINNFFYLTFIKNEGASFGILQGSQVFFIIVTSIVLVAAAVFMVKSRKTQSLFLKITLSLIIGGALGNFIDRILYAYVRDFLDFHAIGFPWIFNVADACLVVGSILLGIYIIFIYKESDGKSIFAKRDKDVAEEDNE